MKHMFLLKKFKCLLLTIVLLLTVNSYLNPTEMTDSFTSHASTPYTWNNVIPEKTPLPANDNGKLVLFDTSHGGTEGSADWVIDGAFSSFADALVAEGYTVREYRGIDKNNDGAIRFYDDRQPSLVALNECVITYAGISQADVFVMAEPNRPLKTSEYDALMQFVNAGKGIYFIADHYNADRNLNTWDATEVFNGYNRSTDATYNLGGEYGDMRNPQDANLGWLSENFGIRFRFNAIDCKSGVSDVRPASQTEGITQGVDPILMAGGATLSIVDGSKAKGLVYLSSSDNATKWSYAADTGLYFGGEAEGPYVAISKPSTGKAAFIGDSSPVEDDTPKYLRQTDGTTKKTWPGWHDTGHAATLSVNIVNWLATPESYVGFDGVTHTAGTVTPNPMIDIEKAEQQPEPWSNPSGGYDPWNTDTFAAGSFGAPLPSDGTPPNTATFALYPSYVYENEPFAVAITGNATAPAFGAYLDGGSQQGQLLLGGSWTSSGYNNVPTPLPTAVTARIVSVASPPVKIRLKASGNTADTKTVTGLTTGYGYLQGAVTGTAGHIVAALKDNVILGTAQIDASGQASIAVKEDTGITLAVYGIDGTFINHLNGNYSVTNGNTTPIVDNGSSALSVAAALAEPNGTEVTLTGYITSDLNGIYAIKVADTNDASAQSIAVKLEASMRDEFSPLNNPSALGRKIVVTGTRNDYMLLPGLRNVTSIEFVGSSNNPDPLSVAASLNKANGTTVTLTGYIVADLNGIYAVKVADTNDSQADFIAVKLEANMRDEFSPLNNPNALGKKIIVTGTRNDYMLLPGLREVSSIAFAEDNPSALTVAQAKAEPNGTVVTLTGYIVADLNGIYAVKVADTNNGQADFIAVKLESNMRDQFSPLNNPSALGRKIRVTGKRNDYMLLPGLKYVSSIEFVN
ncbi:hypothetical protein HZI73_14760 [Vallitalea pronyensis]|uniref:Endonuclease YhcR N-terminal domain-containing protein n=1 Tax=Vallitalea pronyensis TaxID=1348613 RepID=A0A8J8MLI9_9FIRM|nr:DUF6359 domain-containing protein [Vallitalea pronyensis]QUI23468.1 hypothetical protein HZI73_14760 [Vallitalea pronyensis]